MASPLLTATGLRKSFGPVTVLQEVSLELHAGEVHALVGENGAGKTTLCRIIAGLVAPDSGHLTLAGESYSPRNRREAAERGVRMVLQELNLIGNLTLAENIFLEHLPHRGGWIRRQRLRALAREALARVGLDGIDPDLPADRLGVGQQQLVEIAAGLSRPCRVLILDEPTAALTDPEIDHLFDRLAGLKAAGTGILYISHRLEEITRLADRISVLRDGALVTTRPRHGFPPDAIVRLMVGRELEAAPPSTPRQPGPIALRVVRLRRPPAVREVSFELRQGEILGLAGLMGSGRTETVRALFGADRPESGAVYLGDSSEPAVIRSPRDAVRMGIGLLTEDRKQQGLLLPLSIQANIALPSLARLGGRAGWMQTGAEHRAAAPWVPRLDLRCRHVEQPVVELSGGNQQKVVLAKWLLRDGPILIFDEPTRGIDVGARFEIHQLLRRLADRGKAILVVSSDLPELLSLADRIAVMSAGRLVQTFTRGEWSEDRIMHAALSGYAPKEEGKLKNADTGTP